MKTLAAARSGHPMVRQLAINILNHRNIKSHNYIDEAKAIAEYVQKNVQYVRDADGIEQLYDPITIIEQLKRGCARCDCDDMALLIASLLKSIGHKPYFRMVRYRTKKGPYQHIYVVVYDKNLNQKAGGLSQRAGGLSQRAGGLSQRAGGLSQKKIRIALDAIVKHKKIGFEVPHMSGMELKA